MVKKIHMAFSNLRQRISTAHPFMMRLLSPRRCSSSSLPSISSHNNVGMGLRSKSEESLNKLNDCINNMNEDVSKLYMEYSETDLRDHLELFNLLSDYFITSGEITELCKSLRKCLETAQDYECPLIDEALHDFEEEKRVYGEGRSLSEASFRKTLQDLTSFNEIYYNSDDEDLVRKSMICRDDIVDLIVKLVKMMKDIDKNLKRMRRVRAVVAVALLVPAIGLMAAKFVRSGQITEIRSLTSYAALMWRKPTESLKMKKIVMVSMERGMRVALKEVEIIVKLVRRLRFVERLIRETAEFAVDKRSPVAEVMGGMEKEQEMMKSTIVDLGRETGRCDDFAQFGRNATRKKIVEFLSPDERGRKN